MYVKVKLNCGKETYKNIKYKFWVTWVSQHCYTGYHDGRLQLTGNTGRKAAAYSDAESGAVMQ